MYVSKLDYDISIYGDTILQSVCSADLCSARFEGSDFFINITSNEDVPTYYKLIYDSGYGYSFKFSNGYDAPSGIISGGETKIIKLIVDSGYNQGEIKFKINGGFINNNLEDIDVDDNYSETYTMVYATLFETMQGDNEIFADNVNSTYVKNSTPGINFAAIGSDTNGKGLYYTSDLTKTEDFDGDGTGERVYYYRGNVENNNLAFAGYCWKIIRSNEDGSIRLRYSGVYDDTNKCLSVTSIGTAPFNYTYGDSTYLGYMVGIDNQCTSEYCKTTTNSTSYNQAHSNTYNSTVKSFIDSWYENNILTQGNTITSKIANTIYCNDRKIAGEDEGFSDSYYKQLGYGTEGTVFSPNPRLKTNNNPQFKCEQQNDEFTLSVSAGGTNGYGNNKLTYPVALLTADEVMFAGNVFDKENENNFLHFSSRYWTMSVSHELGGEDIMYVDSIKSLGYGPSNAYIDLFPVLSLRTDVLVTGGSGLSDDPYIIE